MGRSVALGPQRRPIARVRGFRRSYRKLPPTGAPQARRKPRTDAL